MQEYLMKQTFLLKVPRLFLVSRAGSRHKTTSKASKDISVSLTEKLLSAYASSDQLWGHSTHQWLILKHQILVPLVPI